MKWNLNLSKLARVIANERIDMRFELMSEYLTHIHNHWIDTASPSNDELKIADDYYLILKNIIFRNIKVR